MVKVYSQPQCMQCVATKKYLVRAGVEFEEVDISQSPQAREEVLAMGYTQAPVVKVGESHWSGFRPDRLSQISLVGSA